MPALSTTDRKPAEDFTEVLRLIAPQMAALDGFMTKQVDNFEPEIRTMAAYCLESSGKRIRPTLVFVAGWQSEEAPLNESLVRAAGVVEMIHLATLVHDDIMDGAEIRRNRRTASRAFGADAAVLLGDALFSQALHIASQFPTVDVCRLVSESTRKVCSGEIVQTMRRRDTHVTLDDYYRVIDLKTAELFRVSCVLGALLAGQPRDFIQAANDFGRHLGVAYQIYDDLVDFFGEEKQIGKTLGTDLAGGKLTLPLMLLLEKLAGPERAELLAALAGNGVASHVASAARMREHNIVHEVRKAIETELAAAQQALHGHEMRTPVNLMIRVCNMLKNQVDSLNIRAAQS
jgi:octaprenyl-diphosphate synthase